MPTYQDAFRDWAREYGWPIEDFAWEFAAWMEAFYPGSFKDLIETFEKLSPAMVRSNPAPEEKEEA